MRQQVLEVRVGDVCRVSVMKGGIYTMESVQHLIQVRFGVTLEMALGDTVKLTATKTH